MVVNNWQFIQVGAGPAVINAAGKLGFTTYSGENVSLGKGVQAINDIAKNSDIISNMSPMGQAAVASGMRAINQLAAGNLAAATTTVAASVIAATGYLTAKAVAEGAVSTVTLTASEIASGLGAMVPLLGAYVDAMATYSGSATGKSPEEIQAACQLTFGSVKWGTAPDGRVLPTDIFMAPRVNDEVKPGPYGAYQFYKDDGLRLLGKKIAGVPYYENSLGGLLSLLDSNASNLSGNEKKVWPNAGLTPSEKKIAKNLRLAIMAAYQRPGFVRQYMADNGLPGPYSAAAEPTDGGYALWPLYADIFWQAWRQGRLPSSFLIYVMAREEENVDALLQAYLVVLGFQSAAKGDPDGKRFNSAMTLAKSVWMNQSDSGKNIPCVTLDDRATGQFVAMVTGWDQFVESHYVNVPGLQAPNNPLHGGVITFRPQPRPVRKSVLPLALIVGAGTLYFKPQLVSKLFASTKNAVDYTYTVAKSNIKKVI